MSAEFQALRAFYAGPTGRVAARLLRDRLRAVWPRLPGLSVLGLGHAAPYLRLWRAEAARCVALCPAHHDADRALAGARPGWSADWPADWPHPGRDGTPPRDRPLPVRWPAAGPSATLLAEEAALPFPDRSFDRVLLVHGLEAADNARRLLREVWRVLADDGRLLVVAPNRRGFWAHLERTPFGHGQPYTAGQVGRLLGRHLFRVERRETALFLPPVRSPLLRRAAPLLEGPGRALAPRYAGLVVVEAEKDLFAPIPAGAVRVRRLMPALARPARLPGAVPAREGAVGRDGESDRGRPGEIARAPGTIRATMRCRPVQPQDTAP